MEKFIKYPFAVDGDRTAIPDETQTSGEVSYEQGFGYDYSRDQSTDPLAKNIPRDGMNALLYDITRAVQELQGAGIPDYITPALNGGTAYAYPLNALVRYDAGSGVKVYRSLVADNTADPSDATKWADIAAAATTTAKGMARLATVPEAITGTAEDIAVTPAGLSAVMEGQQQTVPRGYLSGLPLSNNDSSPTTTVDFGAGQAADTTTTYLMSLPATVSKTLQSAGAWAPGNGNNGLFSGAKANSTWYHCFLIRKADGTVDCGFDTSVTAENIPAGYTAYRRVGSIKTDSSGNILGFHQIGDRFWLDASITDLNTTSPATVATDLTVSVPPGVVTVAIMDVIATVSGANPSASLYIVNPGRSGGGRVSYIGYNGSLQISSATSFEAPSNAAGKIRYYVGITGTLAFFQLSTHGWFDSRGKDS